MSGIAYPTNASAGIKSIQRGTIACAGGGPYNSTITAVNTSKTILTHLGQDFSNTTIQGITVSLSLTSSTNVQAARGTTDGTPTNVSYQVVEYY